MTYAYSNDTQQSSTLLYSPLHRLLVALGEGALVDGGEHVVQVDGVAERETVRNGGPALLAVGHVDCEQSPEHYCTVLYIVF